MKTRQSQKAPRGTGRRVLSYLRGYRFYLFASLFLALVTVLCTLAIPVLIGRVIDCIVGKGNVDFPRIFRLFEMCVACIGTAALSQWLMNIANNRMSFGVLRNLRNDAFRHLQKVPLSYLDSRKIGDVVSRVIADADQLSDGLLLGFTQFFTGILTILGTLIFMLTLHPAITLVVVLVTPLSLVVASFIARRTYKMFRLQSEIRGKETALMEEAITQHKTVVAFSEEDALLARFDDVNDQLTKASQRAIFFSSTVNPSTRFVNGLVYAGVAFFGALSVIAGGSGALSVGELSCFLAYATQYTKPFNEISGVIAELQGALAGAARIFEVIDSPAETPDAQDAAVLRAPRGEVVFENLSFSYTPERPLIDNMNIRVRAGEHIAIVGPTGCGKTTLINLLMRFYDPTGGRILIDGKDLRSVTRESLRHTIGMVLQDTWLTSGTVAENIAFGKPDATREEIVAAATAAHAHAFILRLPKGYDTPLGEGDALSRGEKQLLCIARLFLELPPVLILDEATSSIDTRTEMQIQKAFSALMAGRTSFVVAHRLSTVRESDLILVMRDGKLVEQGKHEELLARKGFYAELYNSQLQRAEKKEAR